MTGRTQQIDSLFFNLYTDSLKKGTHNYINVDAKMSNGRWLPMTSRELVFSSSVFQFSGNELIIPADCTEEKVDVKAVLRSNPSVAIERRIWIKQLPDPELPRESGSPASRPVKGRRRG
ncbi:MAG: hypothetical protein EOO05_11775 [Chitinophagaceae bacterium]|nr:MAG: hypothetical protein EOO05_11775 [Chitinophagaceae bacterium]